MEKYNITVKDLVFQANVNGSDIYLKAGNGDALSCFQMGMIHLLGINTVFDFKSAFFYFSNPSLKDNPEANSLLGFIAECEGNYLQAFHFYAKTISNSNSPFLYNVINGRNYLQHYLKELCLPIVMNHEISTILDDYCSDNISRLDVSVKVAAICDDTSSYLEVAYYLYQANNLLSAVQWLQKAQVQSNNTIYTTIIGKYKELKDRLLCSKDVTIFEIDNYSLLNIEDPSPYMSMVKESCDNASKMSFMEWKAEAKSYVNDVQRMEAEAECRRREKAEAERRRMEAEAERRRREKEEARKKAIQRLIEKEHEKQKIRNIVISIILGILVLIPCMVIVGIAIFNKSTPVENSEIIRNVKLCGTVDQYPITMTLQINKNEVKGTYYYNKQGSKNVLSLSGVKKKTELDLIETNEKGQKTGHFIGNYSNGVFEGEFIDYNGKGMSFKVLE